MSNTPAIAPSKPWPLDEMNDDLRLGLDQWRETTEDIYWQQLEVLPPIRQAAASFMVGEPLLATSDGFVHACFVNFNRRFFGRYLYLSQWTTEPKRLRESLKASSNDTIPAAPVDPDCNVTGVDNAVAP